MLRRLVVANLIASGAHFLHNAMFLESYPGPPWISGPWVVVGAWLVVAAALVLGYRWHVMGRTTWARAGISLYGASCLLVFGHYVYGPPSEFDLLTNLLIFGEGTAGIFLLMYYLWLTARAATP